MRRPSSRYSNVVFTIFILYLLLQFVVVATQAVTMYDFSSQTAQEISTFLWPYSEVALLATPNQAFLLMASRQMELSVSLFVTGLLTAVTGWTSYLLVTRANLNLTLLLLGYFLTSAALSYFVVNVLLFV